MTQELTVHDDTALAMQFLEIDPSKQLTGADRRDIAKVTELFDLYRMRTDIDNRHTMQEQANAFGVTIQTIKRWVKSDLYSRIVQFMAPPKSNPMVAAAVDYLKTELLPRALREARVLLEDEDTPANAKVALIKEVMRAAMANQDTESADAQRRSAMEFLRGQNITIETLNMLNAANPMIPTEYQEAMSGAIDIDVVDAES